LALATPPPAGCGPDLSLLAEAGAADRPAGLASPSGPVCALSTGGAPALAQAVVYHGFCRCSCTRIPDCNTSAQCGGAPCEKAITCC
jgi:hypothetical protein